MLIFMSVVEDVKGLYESFPYPAREVKTKEKLEGYVKWLLPILNQKSTDFFLNKNVLELGCGTGELGNSLALFGSKITGVDISKTSLKKAKELSERFDLTTNYLNQNLLKLDLNKEFDLVLALGCLHHTSDAKKGFEIAVKHCKQNGLVVVGLYNKFGRIRLRLKNKIIDLFVGSDITKRIVFAKKYFANKRDQQKGDHWIADKFAHPFETYHSIEEVRKWFKELNLKEIASRPKIEKNSLITQLKWFWNKQGAFFVITAKKC